MHTKTRVADLIFESPDEYGEICVRFDLTVHGTFQYWTGSEFVAMTQAPVPQRVRNCRAVAAFRQDLVDFYLDPVTGTFDLSRLTADAAPVYFDGSDGSTFLGSAPLAPLVLNATTYKQRKAIRDLRRESLSPPAVAGQVSTVDSAHAVLWRTTTAD